MGWVSKYAEVLVVGCLLGCFCLFVWLVVCGSKDLDEDLGNPTFGGSARTFNLLSIMQTCCGHIRFSPRLHRLAYAIKVI